jgi:alkylhydroperoxidase family enzyme
VEPTERERAALAFAEKLAANHTTIDEAFVTGMRRHFTDAELVELGLITGAFIMLGRLHRTFGVAPMGPRSHAVLERGYDA